MSDDPPAVRACTVHECILTDGGLIDGAEITIRAIVATRSNITQPLSRKLTYRVLSS